jgi:cyclic pyranopterin phosphate synthase
MPESGLSWIKQSELMTDEEMLRICSVFAMLGVDKIRITGGERLYAKTALTSLKKYHNLKAYRLSLTTNGLLTEQYIPQLKQFRIQSVNLSLDTLNEERFFRITRRKAMKGHEDPG